MEKGDVFAMSETEKTSYFRKMVDDLVEFAEYDKELKDGIQWLDGEALKKGMTFYDIVFELLYNHEVNTNAKKWLDDKK